MELSHRDVLNALAASPRLNFKGARFRATALAEAIRLRGGIGAPFQISEATVVGDLFIDGLDTSIRFERCTLEHLDFKNLDSANVEFADCHISSLIFYMSEVGTLALSNCTLGPIHLNSTYFGETFFSDSTLGASTIYDCRIGRSCTISRSTGSVLEFLGAKIGKNISLNEAFFDGIGIRDSEINGDILGREATHPILVNSKVHGAINISPPLEDSPIADAPGQQQAPISLGLTRGQFDTAPHQSDGGRLSGMRSAHAQIKEAADHALGEFEGRNRARVADVIRSYLLCLGQSPEVMDEIGLGFAAVRLEAQAKHLYEDGNDLLFAEKRAALEELLAVHRHFEAQLTQWREFQERATQMPISENAASLVAKAAGPLAAGMVKAPDFFTPQLRHRLSDLAEAGDEPGIHTPEVRYGMAQGVANTVNFLGGFVLRVMRKSGKKTADRLEEELSDEASEKLAKAAKALLLGSAKQLLALSGIPMFEWVGRVVKLFLEEEEGKGKD